MASLPTVHLKRNAAERILAGHPWIFPANIDRVTHDPQDGGEVQVRDARRRFLGTGLYNSRSRIRVRLLSRQREAIDTGFFLRRLKQARAHRQKVVPEARCHRLVHAEGDLLSGLVVDRYHDTFCLQVSSLGMEARLPQIREALLSLAPGAEFVERRDLPSRRTEGLSTGTAEGEPRRQVVQVNQLRLEVDPVRGHKTGLYLDQQANYQEAARLLQRWKVRSLLDAFAYQGAFALHAASLAGCRATGIDQSPEVLDQARRNASLNQLSSQCTFEAANVFDWLKGAPREAAFDAIVLDPPSFTRSRSSVEDALRGYKEIHLRALRLLAPGGILLSFCCSHHVDAPTFEAAILGAAFDNRQHLRRVARFGQSPDHPVLPAVPETGYLKGFAYQVLEL